jgi:putative endonuclease
MDGFHVYVLQSLKDGRYYIGSTNNVTDRLKRHNEGRVSVTRNRRPFVLVYHETYRTRGEALKRELYLKSLKGGNEFKRIIGIAL